MKQRDGVTPKAVVLNDVTPIQIGRCFCDGELIMVDADENPPLTQAEKDLQFHCLMSRARDWVFCRTTGDTWLKHSSEPV